jgi:hypothetical protein
MGEWSDILVIFVEKYDFMFYQNIITVANKTLHRVYATYDPSANWFGWQF